MTAVRCGPAGLFVEGRIGDRVKTLIAMTVTNRSAKQVRKAWKEYRFRSLEQPGTIEGSATSPRYGRFFRMAIAIGIVEVIVVLAALPVFRSVLTTMLTEMMVYGWGSVFWITGVLGLLMCLLLTIVVAGVIWITFFCARCLRAMKHCGRWAFSRDGFAIWPGGKRRLFTLPLEMSAWLLHNGHYLTPRIGGELVALGDGTVAWPVLLAFNEREGGRVRSRFWVLALAEWLAVGFIWFVTVCVACLAQADESGAVRDQVIALVVKSAILTVCIPAFLYWVKKRDNRVLAEGREMLKRLGW